MKAEQPLSSFFHPPAANFCEILSPWLQTDTWSDHATFYRRLNPSTETKLHESFRTNVGQRKLKWILLKKLFYIGMKRQSMFVYLYQVQNASMWVFIPNQKIRERKKINSGRCSGVWACLTGAIQQIQCVYQPLHPPTYPPPPAPTPCPLAPVQGKRDLTNNDNFA